MSAASTPPGSREPRVAYIDVAKDFSEIVGGREEAISQYSGEAFLRDVLRPAYLQNDRIVVGLDGIKLYGASFFDESFGGLVRDYGLVEVESKISFVAVRRAHLILLIQSWMRLAEDERRKRR